jgi:acyl-CoA thioesterase-1
MKHGFLGLALALIACAPSSNDTTQQSAHQGMPVANTPKPSKRVTVLFIGTSLTAGYGLEPDQAFPSLVERMADSAGTPITAVNAGVSGETSADALQRIDWVLHTRADAVVLETGANDGLRALPLDAVRANIAAIIDRVKFAKPGVPLVLIQIEVPPNMGQSYFTAFHNMYGEIAREKGVVLLPFLLAGVAGQPQLNQGDGIHPNVVGERIVASNIWRGLQPIIRSVYVTRQ